MSAKGIWLWVPSCQKDVNTLERIQRSIAGVIKGLRNLLMREIKRAKCVCVG